MALCPARVDSSEEITEESGSEKMARIPKSRKPLTRKGDLENPGRVRVKIQTAQKGISDVCSITLKLRYIYKYSYIMFIFKSGLS